MEKKAKVTKVTKFDKVDNYGNTSYMIEFDNGDKGYYSTKDSEQKKFIVGNVSDYVLEEKVGQKGPYNKVKLPETDQKQFGSFQKKQQDPKVQFISFSMSYTKDLIVAGKVPLADMEKEFNRMFNAMISKL